MTRRIPETDWLPEGVTDLFLDTAKPVAPLLTCKGCGKDIDLHCLFVREGVCAECEWGGSQSDETTGEPK